MDVSTRGQRARAFAQGVAIALRHAAWTAPLLAPLGVLQALLVATPWLSSLEAARQDVLISSAADFRTRELLETALDVVHGPLGAGAIALVLMAGWLVAMRLRGPLRSTPPWMLHEKSHRAHALRLLGLLAAAAGCLAIHPGATRLNLLVDGVTFLRPTGSASLALLAASQVAGLVAIGAILGAGLAAARVALHPARQAGALAGLAAIVATIALLQAGVHARLAARFDVGVTPARALGASEEPRPVVLLALARDRSWIVPMRDGLAGVRFTRETAARAEDLLRRRRGWTTLSAQLEPFVVGERLLALDPDTARARALDSLLRLAQSVNGHALLVALGSAAPSEQARRILGTIESDSSLHVGPQARLLIAQAHAQAGDRAGAESALAAVRAGSEQVLIDARAGAPIVLTTFMGGRVSGTILLDGLAPPTRAGLVATKDLFSLPDASEVSVTWLLRLVAAAGVDASGRFEIGGLPEGEMALVLVVPTARDVVLTAETPLPRIEVSAARPSIDLGTIRLAVTSRRNGKSG